MSFLTTIGFASPERERETSPALVFRGIAAEAAWDMIAMADNAANQGIERITQLYRLDNVPEKSAQTAQQLVELSGVAVTAAERGNVVPIAPYQKARLEQQPEIIQRTELGTAATEPSNIVPLPQREQGAQQAVQAAEAPNDVDRARAAVSQAYGGANPLWNTETPSASSSLSEAA